MANISQKTKETTLQLTGKFSKNFLKKVKGKSSASKEDVSFTGKAKEQKGVGATADKIKPLKQGNELIDMLMKIYNFMSKTQDEDKLKNEEANNLKEEQKIEDGKRHDKLIKAIEELKKGLGVESKDTATKENTNNSEGTVFDIVDTILDAFGGAKTALTFMSMLGGFVASPLGVALIGAVVAGTVGSWMIKQIAADPQSALQGKGGIGMAVAGLGSEGQLPSYDEEQSDKELTKKAEQVDKKGLKNATLPELEAKLQQQMEFGNAKTPQVAELKKEIELRKSQVTTTPTATPIKSTESAGSESSPTPEPSVASSLSTGESVVPESSTPASAKLNAVQSENNTAKVNALTESPSTTVNNSSVASSVSKPELPRRTKIPAVRNLEESFQKMIIYSTRVV